MSVIPKVTSEETKITSETYTPIITDPIAPTRISKTNASKLTMSSVVKVSIVSSSAFALYYLAKTADIFSYFGWRAKDSNSKELNSSKIMEVKNRANALTARRNLKATEQANGPSGNQIEQTHKDRDGIVEFKEIKVEEFKNTGEAKEKRSIV